MTGSLEALGGGADLLSGLFGAGLLSDCRKQTASAILRGLRYARKARWERNQFSAKLTWLRFVPVFRRGPQQGEKSEF